MAYEFRHVTADRAHIVAFQFKIGVVGQFVERHCAVDEKFMVVQPLEACLTHVELILNLTDQFLDHIVEGDHADGAAELIDHEGEVSVAVEEKLQQLVERHQFRHGMQRTLDLRQIRRRLMDDRQHVLHVDQTERVLEMAVDQRKTGVFDSMAALRLVVKSRWISSATMDVRGVMMPRTMRSFSSSALIRMSRSVSVTSSFSSLAVTIILSSSALWAFSCSPDSSRRKTWRSRPLEAALSTRWPV